MAATQDLSENDITPHSITDADNENLFRPKPIDASTVILTIKHLKDTNSYGSDGIPLRFLKDALPVITPYLTCIINTSFVTGVFPPAWKHALVTPIYKSGTTDDLSN